MTLIPEPTEEELAETERHNAARQAALNGPNFGIPEGVPIKTKVKSKSRKGK